MLKNKLQTFFIITLVLLGNCSWAKATAINLKQAPAEVVQDVIDGLLTQIRKDKAKGQIDFKAVYDGYEQILMPAVDLNKVTGGVMGKYYKQVTAEQKEQFKAAFREGLVNLYVKAFNKFTDEKLKVSAGTSTDTRAHVRLDIIRKNGEVIPIVYTLCQNKQEEWLICNVRFSGINFVLTYRNLFAASMRKQKGHFDLVLKELLASYPSKAQQKVDATPTPPVQATP